MCDRNVTTDLHDNDFNVFQVSFKILLWRIFFFSVKKIYNLYSYVSRKQKIFNSIDFLTKLNWLANNDFAFCCVPINQFSKKKNASNWSPDFDFHGDNYIMLKYLKQYVLIFYVFDKVFIAIFFLYNKLPFLILFFCVF